MTGGPSTLSGHEGAPLPEVQSGLPDGAVLALPAGGQVLYRLSRPGNPWDAYRSAVAVEKPEYPDNPAVLVAGISMWRTREQAMRRARKSPVVITQVTLTEGLNFYLAKTLGNGHFTVWGDPERLRDQSEIVYENEEVES